MHRSTIIVPAGAAGANYTIGPNVAGSSSGSDSGITGVQVVNPKSGVLQSFTLSLGTGSSGINFLMGLYTDAANLPGTLIANTSTAVAVTINGGMQTVPVVGGATIPAGTYWVAWQSQAAINGTYNNGVPLGAWNNGTSWTGSLPSSFSSAGSGNFQFVGYATLFG